MRIIIDIAAVFSMLFAPFWVTLIVLAIGVFLVRNFYEAIAAGIVIDMLYGIPRDIFFNIPVVATICTIGIYAVVGWFRNSVRQNIPART